MNNTHYITFNIDKNSRIIIPLQDPIEWLGAIYEENILFYHKKQKLFLSKQTIYHDMLNLAELLNKALNNELFLDKSINQDIGYLVHEYHIDENKVALCDFDSGIRSWVGYKYKLWEATNKNLCFMSWIYNSPDGSIIFEITPFYPYMYCEPEEEPNYIPYEEWIKTYKPYFITTLSRETAEQWIEQAEQIIRMVEYNEKRMQYRSKIDVES